MESYIDQNFNLIDFMDKDDCEWVLLVGSAISIWAPSSIPNGQEIRKAIYQILNLGSVATDRDNLLAPLLERLPLELLMDRCPIEMNKVNRILIEFFERFSTPNPIHACLGEMFVHGIATSIITPNYDVCLENSIKTTARTNGFQYTRIINEADAADIDKNRKCVFKIHGSADGLAEDLVFTMKQEGKLPTWKRDLLKRLIEGTHLLVIGYSGYDFDICPELIAASPKSIYWNYLSKSDADYSINAQEVAKQIPTHFLYGDMTNLLSPFLPHKPTKDASYTASIESLQDTFKREVNSSHLKLWQVRIYNTLNFNGTVLQEVDALLKEDNTLQTELIREKAIALVNSGRYCQGSTLYAQLALTEEDTNEKNLLFALAEHSLLASGAYFKYLCSKIRRKYKTVNDRDHLSTSDNSQDAHNFIQLLSYLYKFNLPIISTLIRSLAGKRIQTIGERYHSDGDWYGISRLQVLAAEFGLLGEVQILSAYQLPPIEKAYHQLAFPIGVMMAFRKSLENRTIDQNGKSFFDEGERLLTIAQALEIYPEVWKLAYALDKHCHASDHIEQFWIGFTHCEYSLLRRMSIVATTYYTKQKSKPDGARAAQS